MTFYGAKPKSQSKIIAGARPDLSQAQSLKLAKKANSALVGKKDRTTGLYSNGLASDYFNYNVKNLDNPSGPRVPVLNTPFPRSLNPVYNNKVNSGTPAANNYAIQSGCAIGGMLSLFLLFAQRQIDSNGLSKYARYSCAIHDESWFLCHESKTKELAECIVRAHAQTWAYFMYRMGIVDYPLQRLYYDCVVDFTKVLRKEANYKVVTATYEYTQMGYQYFVNEKTGKLEKRTFDGNQLDK